VKVRVDPELCQGHTLCALAAPGVFRLSDEDGHSYVDSAEVPPDLEASVARAAATCPEGAILISD